MLALRTWWCGPTFDLRFSSDAYLGLFCVLAPRVCYGLDRVLATGLVTGPQPWVGWYPFHPFWAYRVGHEPWACPSSCVNHHLSASNEVASATMRVAPMALQLFSCNPCFPSLVYDVRGAGLAHRWMRVWPRGHYRPCVGRDHPRWAQWHASVGLTHDVRLFGAWMDWLALDCLVNAGVNRTRSKRVSRGCSLAFIGGFLVAQEI